MSVCQHGAQRRVCAVCELDADLHRLAAASMRLIEDFYGPGDCDCDPSVGIETCAVCEIRGMYKSLRDRD